MLISLVFISVCFFFCNYLYNDFFLCLDRFCQVCCLSHLGGVDVFRKWLLNTLVVVCYFVASYVSNCFKDEVLTVYYVAVFSVIGFSMHAEGCSVSSFLPYLTMRSKTYSCRFTNSVTLIAGGCGMVELMLG